MAALDREEFYQAINAFRVDMREGIEGVHDRLDALNGRTRTNEVDIGVLKERSVPKDTAARATGFAGLISSIGLLLYQWLMK